MGAEEATHKAKEASSAETAWKTARRTINWIVGLDLGFLLLGIGSAQASSWAHSVLCDPNVTNYCKRVPGSSSRWLVLLNWVGWSGLAWGLAAVGVVTFFGSLAVRHRLQDAGGSPMSDGGKQGDVAPESMRLALTIAFAVEYFCALGVFLFFRYKGDVPPLATTMIQNFTFLMGVVIAFHFGSTAYADARAKRENPE